MTVDMLAATFFWPEGTVLGPHHSQPATDEGAAGTAETHEAEDAAVHSDGFWSAVMRHLWRPSPVTPTVTAP